MFGFKLYERQSSHNLFLLLGQLQSWVGSDSAVMDVLTVGIFGPCWSGFIFSIEWSVVERVWSESPDSAVEMSPQWRLLGIMV